MKGLGDSSSSEWNPYRAPWRPCEGAPRSPSYQWPPHVLGVSEICTCGGGIFDSQGALGHELSIGRGAEGQLGPWP